MARPAAAAAAAGGVGESLAGFSAIAAPVADGARAYAQRKVAVGKTLSWMLRHHAVECGLDMRPDGYVDLAAVLAQKKLGGAPLSLVEEIVSTCPKQRYSIVTDAATGSRLIRANQGHSIKGVGLDDEAMLTRITSADQAPVCVHGTYVEAWRSIRSSGIKRMARRHIHFAAGELEDAAVKSGLRTSAQVYMYLDVAEALKAGLPLFRSANNVLLTSGFEPDGVIPMHLFQRVVMAKSRVVLWPLAASAASAVEPLSPASAAEAGSSTESASAAASGAGVVAGIIAPVAQCLAAACIDSGAGADKTLS